MKFWRIVSLFRDESAILEEVFGNSDMEKYKNWYSNFSRFVDSQKRTVLDSEIPEELCRRIMELSKKNYYIKNGYLYRYTGNIPDRNSLKIYTAFEVYNNFGGDCMEEIEEYGSYKL